MTYASPPPSRRARTIRSHREHHVAGLFASDTLTSAPHALHLHMTGDRSTEAPPSGRPGICAPILYSLVDADQASRRSTVMLTQGRLRPRWARHEGLALCLAPRTGYACHATRRSEEVCVDGLGEDVDKRSMSTELPSPRADDPHAFFAPVVAPFLRATLARLTSTA